MRTRDWRTIWAFKDRLPRGSQYNAALAMDIELAEKLIERDEEDPDGTEISTTPAGYSIDTYLLLAVIDAIQGVQAAVIASAGVDPPAMHPMPRPATALDAAREARRMRSIQQLIDEFTNPGFGVEPDEDSP